ncbi:MAG: VWA domain-containing protein [Magnetococcales bacterium]|nr:VWA domain-containing protein [Magnetococcales bacterium]
MKKTDLKDSDIQNALNSDQIPAYEKTAKQQAIEAALQQFDEQTEKKFQGSSLIQRPILITANIFKKIGDWIMNISYSQMATISGLAIAVLVVALMPQMQEQIPAIKEQQYSVKSSSQLRQKTEEIAAEEEVAVLQKRADIQSAKKPQPQAAAVQRKMLPPVASYQYAPTPESMANLSAMPQADYDVAAGGGGVGVQHEVNAPTIARMPTKMARIAKLEAKSYNRSRLLGAQQMAEIAQPLNRVADHIEHDQFAENRDRFAKPQENPVRLTNKHPVSTFSVDVDTASYSFVRRQINAGRLPQPKAVRIEEMINYFSYDYPTPTVANRPFKPTIALYPTPWNNKTQLLHIGIKGYSHTPISKKSNLVFLIDVSGSMSSQDKLPLLKNGLKMLVDSLKPDDTVAIVVYAGAAGTVLEPTSVKQRAKIIAALDRLQAGGSTAGGAGIDLAYSLAQSGFVKGDVNRIILATDGDFNVGITDKDALKGMIEQKRKSGIFLSVLGFGQGNYNDRLMQELAQNGNGIAAYIDNLNEARKVLVQEATANLFPIAKDVKIQVEFNPEQISEYRLIGYETRALKREDFKNDKVDAGDIGSGHTVTAIYEVSLVGGTGQLISPLRYGSTTKPRSKSEELAYLKIRYKLPNETKSKLISRAIVKDDQVDDLNQLSSDIRFGSAVAAFGQLLGGGRYTGDFSYQDIIKLANSSKGDDQFGYRAEFVSLLRLADSLK